MEEVPARVPDRHWVAALGGGRETPSSFFDWDEGSTGKKCEKLAEGIAGNSSPSEELFMGKSSMIISTVWTHSENVTIMTGSARRRHGLWNHWNRS